MQAETTVSAVGSFDAGTCALRYAYTSGTYTPAHSPCPARSASPVPIDSASGTQAVTTASAATPATSTARVPCRRASAPLMREITAYVTAYAEVAQVAVDWSTSQARAMSGSSGMATYNWPTTKIPRTAMTATTGTTERAGAEAAGSRSAYAVGFAGEADGERRLIWSSWGAGGHPRSSGASA